MAQPMKIIDKHQLRQRVPYSQVHIGRLEKAGLFPRRVKLGPRRVGWVESEIDAWCQARIDERDAKA